MKWVSYTIYQGDRVGMTIKPTPSLSKQDLTKLISELQAILREMEDA